MSRNIDKLFKEKLGGVSADYKAKDWKAFESQFFGDASPAYADRWLWFLLAFIVVSFFVFLPSTYFYSEAVSSDQQTYKSNTLPSHDALHDIRLDHVASPNDENSTRLASLSHSYLAAYSPSLERNINSSGWINDQGSRSYKEEIVGVGNNETVTENLTITFFAENQRANLKSSNLPKLPFLQANALFSAENLLSESDLSSISYSPKSNISYTAGWMLGGDKLGDLGMFVELSYPLNEIFSLSIRPGVFHTSVSNEKDVFTHEMYDFGRNELEIELESRARFYVDLPLFFSVQSQRHRFGLGGGLRMAVGERFNETQMRISDKNRVSERPVKEKVSDRSYWTRAGANIAPFVEGVYTYRLHPKWSLGLRSRMNLASSVSEGQASPNRLHYGLLLTYEITK